MPEARISWVRYLFTFLGMTALGVLSLLLSFVQMGPMYIAVALVLATLQVTLAFTFFMHLADERFSLAMVPIVVVLLVGLFISLIATDVATRTTFPRGPIPSIDPPGATMD